jgi:hypothetical protein
LVGEGKVDVGQRGEREGRLFGKFAGVGAKGTKLKFVSRNGILEKSQLRYFFESEQKLI